MVSDSDIGAVVSISLWLAEVTSGGHGRVGVTMEVGEIQGKKAVELGAGYSVAMMMSPSVTITTLDFVGPLTEMVLLVMVTGPRTWDTDVVVID